MKYEERLISNAHSEISRKKDHVFKQTKVGSKVQYFSYKWTYLFFDIVALSFNTLVVAVWLSFTLPLFVGATALSPWLLSL